MNYFAISASQKHEIGKKKHLQMQKIVFHTSYLTNFYYFCIAYSGQTNKDFFYNLK